MYTLANAQQGINYVPARWAIASHIGIHIFSAFWQMEIRELRDIDVRGYKGDGINTPSELLEP